MSQDVRSEGDTGHDDFTRIDRDNPHRGGEEGPDGTPRGGGKLDGVPLRLQSPGVRPLPSTPIPTVLQKGETQT